MPSASGSRTPGFRFKDGKLMIFREDEVMIIQGWGNAVGCVQGCHIYRVLHPSCATMCIRRQADGNWGISELKGSYNRPIDQATMDFDNQWLDIHRMGV